MVAAHLLGCAAAAARGMAIPAAFAGVHRADQHEAAGEADAGRHAGDRDRPILQGLAQHLQRVHAKLRQLIQKEHPVVGQADLPRPGYAAAAGQTRRRHAVVGRAEGPMRDDRVLPVGQARHGVDLRGLDDLLPAHVRQDARQTLGHHGLARARRAYDQDVMAAGRGDLQRALYVLLALHVREVRARELHLAQIRGRGGAEALLPAQMMHQLHHVLHRVDGQALGKGGLAGVFRRDIELFDPRLLRRQRHGQRPGHGPQLAGQRELAQEGRVPARLPDLLRGGQIGHQDGQIVERAGFLPVRRRQVHGDAAGVKAEAVVADRGAHPFPGFLDRRVRQAHDVKGGHAVGDVELHRDGKAADAAHAEAVDLGKHRDSPLFQTKAPQGGSLDPRAGLFLLFTPPRRRPRRCAARRAASA